MLRFGRWMSEGNAGWLLAVVCIAVIVILELSAD